VIVALSERLLESEVAGCNFGFVAYYLPSMRPGAGAWAIAELGPEIKVSILGLSAEDESALLERGQTPAEIFGVWVDDTSYSSVLSLYRDAGGLKLGRWYADGGQATEPIRITRAADGVFELADAAGGSGRRYRLAANGDLETWDGTGALGAARNVRLEVDLAQLATSESARRAGRARAASAGRSLARAAAAEERWRKFNDWLTLYHGSLDPARNVVLFLGALHNPDERAAACSQLSEIARAVPADRLRATPSDRIDVDPLLRSLIRLQEGCVHQREVQVLVEASAANRIWNRLDRAVEQLTAELRPEEE